MSPSEKPASAVVLENDPWHRNEEWWHQYGGANWLQEIEARVSEQRHYRQQEAFLLGLFLAMPTVRALDFGCGYGRHLKNLRSVPGLDLHGCDISAKMVEAVSSYLGDPDYVEKRVRLIETRSRLPYEDDSFDLVFTSEVLIHVDVIDVLAVARELWRISSSMIVHIENRPVDISQRENSAHGGCWLHNFKAIYDELGPNQIFTFPEVIEKQCVYIIVKPGSKLAGAVLRTAEALLAKDLAAKLADAQGEAARLRAELKTIANERAALESEVQRLNDSLPIQLADQVKALPLASAGARLLRRIVPTTHRVVRPSPDGWNLPPDVNASRETSRLAFGGIATRSSKPTIEEFVQDQPKVVALCHPDWRGVRAATYGQAEHVLEVPGILSVEHCNRLVSFIGDCNVKSLIINGYPPAIDELVLALKRRIKDIEIYLVYHGTPALVHFREDLVIERMLQLVDAGAVRKLGFLKSGLAECIATLGYPAQWLMNICRVPFNKPAKAITYDTTLEIGVFAPNLCHKNVQTQVIAALMVPGSLVHVCEAVEMAYLHHWRDRVQVHGILPNQEFLELLAAMHATLCVSLIECYPMTVLESLAAGTICLTSYTSGVFESDPELQQALVVPQHDNPYAIAHQLLAALKDRERLVSRAQQHIRKLNTIAERRLQDFLAP